MNFDVAIHVLLSLHNVKWSQKDVSRHSDSNLVEKKQNTQKAIDLCF